MIVCHLFSDIFYHQKNSSSVYSIYSFPVDGDTFDCFHLMIHLLTIEESIFIVNMMNILFDHNFLDFFRGFTVFTIVFDIRIHFTSETNKFCYYFTSCLIFELTNYFLIGLIIEFTIFWIITVIKLTFIRLKVFVDVFCSNFTCETVSICEQ